MPEREMITGEQMLERLVALSREKRGGDLVALDVRELVQYMDFLLVVTSRSERQNRAIAEHIVRSMKRKGVVPLSKSGIEGGHWICIDLVDVVVHLFTPETRKHYDLELLWADAETVELPPVDPAAIGADDPEGALEFGDAVVEPVGPESAGDEADADETGNRAAETDSHADDAENASDEAWAPVAEESRNVKDE